MAARPQRGEEKESQFEIDWTPDWFPQLSTSRVRRTSDHIQSAPPTDQRDGIQLSDTSPGNTSTDSGNQHDAPAEEEDQPNPPVDEWIVEIPQDRAVKYVSEIHIRRMFSDVINSRHLGGIHIFVSAAE